MYCYSCKEQLYHYDVTVFFNYYFTMKNLTLLTLLCVSFILVGCGKSAIPTTDTANNPTPTAVAPTDDTAPAEEGVPAEETAPTEEGTPTEDTDAPTEANDWKLAAEGYATYNEAVVQDALSKWKKVALFFHASRCPNCVALNGNIETNFAKIPADTMIFKVDYDTSDALKEKYGVTTQTTIVYIDKDMEEVNKVNSPINLDEVLAGFGN